MRLHPQLSLLVAVAIAPVLVLAVAAGVLLVRHERQTMQQEAIGRTQSAMSAVEAEIRGHFDDPAGARGVQERSKPATSPRSTRRRSACCAASPTG